MKRLFIFAIAIVLQQAAHAQIGWCVAAQRADNGITLDSVVYYRAEGNGMFVIKDRDECQVQIRSERGKFSGIWDRTWTTPYCGAYVKVQLYDSLMVFKKDFDVWLDRDSTLTILKTREKLRV